MSELPLNERVESLHRELLAEARRELDAGQLDAAEHRYAQVRKDATAVGLLHIVAEADQGLSAVSSWRLLQQIKVAQQAGDTKQAEVTYRSLVDLHPSDLRMNVILADMAVDFGERAQKGGWLNEAGEYYFQALRLRPDHPPAKRHLEELANMSYQLGQQSQEEGNPVSAQDYYRDALRWNPRHADASRQLAFLAPPAPPATSTSRTTVPDESGGSRLPLMLGTLILLTLVACGAGVLIAGTQCRQADNALCRSLPEPLVAMLVTATPPPTDTPYPTAVPTATPSATFTPTPTPTSTDMPTPTNTPTPTSLPIVELDCALLVTGPDDNYVVPTAVNRDVVIGREQQTRVTWNNLTPIPGGCAPSDLVGRRYRLGYSEDASKTAIVPIGEDLRLQAGGDDQLILPVQFKINPLTTDTNGEVTFVLQSWVGEQMWTNVEPLRLVMQWNLRAVTPTPIPTSTFTPVPPTPTRIPTLQPTATQTVADIEQLLEPAADVTADGQVIFRWASQQPLAGDQYYEVVMWKDGAAPASAGGVAGPIKETSLTADLSQVSFLGTGAYYWTVIVVRVNPYERLTQPLQQLGRRIYVKAG